MNDETIPVVSVSGPQLRLPLQAAPVTRRLVGSSALSDGSGIEPSSWWDTLIRYPVASDPVNIW
jgi:hypothetical protein